MSYDRSMDLGTHGIWQSTEFTGEGNGLLALHGFTGSGTDFVPLARALGRPIHAPDLPGHGSEPLPGHWHTGRIVEALTHLHDELRPPPPILFGYSMGGRTALHLAAAEPSRFSALILVGTTAGIEGEGPRAERRTWDERWALRLEEEGLLPFLDAWAELPIITSQVGIPEATRREMRLRRERHRPQGLAASLREAGAGAMPPIWSRLEQLNLPTLLIVGENDEAYRRHARRMELHLPRARVAVISGVGHCAHLEDTPTTAREIHAFLDSLEL